MRPWPSLCGAATVLALLCPAAPSEAQPVPTREEEARRRQEVAEREAIVELLYRERILAVAPDTFHPARPEGSRPVQALVEELLALDLSMHLVEHGGIENLDRLHAAAEAWRARSTRDARRWREALADRMRPSPEELNEAARAGMSVQEMVARGEEPAPGLTPGAAPASVASAPPAAPLDYIPVRPEELHALREKYQASGRPAEAGWVERLAKDPAADAEWKAAQRESELQVARQSTTWATNKGTSYEIGIWLQDTWKKKEPFGLALMAIFLLGIGAVAYLGFRLFRRDD